MLGKGLLMKTLFFVEDDEGVQEIARLVFGEPEFDTHIFSSAEELLDVRARPRVYVLDKQLPGMDGLELCRILKSDPWTSGIPVVMISADPDIRAEGMSAGAEAVLEKPFSIHVLLEVVLKVSA